MRLGYMRVSKADSSQMLDLQRDALLAAGVTPERLYEDLASGRNASGWTGPPCTCMSTATAHPKPGAGRC